MSWYLIISMILSIISIPFILITPLSRRLSKIVIDNTDNKISDLVEDFHFQRTQIKTFGDSVIIVLHYLSIVFIMSLIVLLITTILWLPLLLISIPSLIIYKISKKKNK